MATGVLALDAWRAAARIAARQASMIGVDQLHALGFSPADIVQSDASGRLLPVHHGVRALGHRRDDDLARWWAARLAGGEDARVSHRSAVEAQQLLRPAGGPIHVVVRRNQRFRQAGIVVHRPRTLLAEDVRVIGGLAVSAPARALVELTSHAHEQLVRRAVHEALVTGLVVPDQMLDALGPGTRRPGAAIVRRALGVEVVDLRSRGERAFNRMVRTTNAGDVIVNGLLETPWGPIRPDFRWPGLRLIVEIDGEAVHGTSLARERDRQRDRRLRSLGWTVVRFSADEVLARPDVVRAEFLDVVAEARGRHLLDLAE